MLLQLVEPATGSVVYEIECKDYFVHQGSLRSCPEWVIEAVDDGEARVHNRLTSSLHMWGGDNGHHIADIGDLVIRQKGVNTYNIKVIKSGKIPSTA